jgi:hypothetical protein
VRRNLTSLFFYIFYVSAFIVFVFTFISLEEIILMLGMEDGLIAFVWVATVVSALGCVVFGGFMWNRGGDDSK